MYDTQFGNGKILAESLEKEFPSEYEIKTCDVKNIDVQSVADENPDILILGGAIRMFRGATKSKKWLKKLDKTLKKNGNNITYATIFLTHGLPTDKVQGFAKRYRKKLEKASTIEQTYPEILNARVKEQKGPILEEEMEKAVQFILKFIDWIQN